LIRPFSDIFLNVTLELTFSFDEFHFLLEKSLMNFLPFASMYITFNHKKLSCKLNNLRDRNLYHQYEK